MNNAYVFGEEMTPLEAYNRYDSILSSGAGSHIHCVSCLAEMHLQNKPGSQHGKNCCFSHKPGTARFCPEFDDDLVFYLMNAQRHGCEDVVRGRLLRQEFLSDEKVHKIWHFWRHLVGEFEGHTFERQQLDGKIGSFAWKVLSAQRFEELLGYADRRKLWCTKGADVWSIALVCAAHILFNGPLKCRVRHSDEVDFKIELQKWAISMPNPLTVSRKKVIYDGDKLTFCSERESVALTNAASCIKISQAETRAVRVGASWNSGPPPATSLILKLDDATILALRDDSRIPPLLVQARAAGVALKGTDPQSELFTLITKASGVFKGELLSQQDPKREEFLISMKKTMLKYLKKHDVQPPINRHRPGGN